MPRQPKPDTRVFAILPRLISAMLLLAMLSVFPNYAVAQGRNGIQLLAPGVGWVAGGSPILWTTDNGGQWKNITPPGKSLGVVSIFFLDRSTGWVLLQAPDVEEPGSSLPWQPKFELAHTKDSGATWSLTQLELGVNPQDFLLVPQGFIQFTDATHGWMNLTVQSGAAFHVAILFRTVDGGKNWISVGAPGTSGPVRFIDQQNGWVASEMDYKLWATHDGAETWTEVSLKPPPEILPAETVVYQLPVFTDKVHGALTVSFSASPNDLEAHAKGSRVALFVTADAGKNWKFDGVLSRLQGSHATVHSAVAGSWLITAEETGGDILTLKQLSLKDKHNSTSVNATVGNTTVGENGGIDAVSFASAREGWVLMSPSHCSPGDETPHCIPQLLSTTDGGNSWIDIAPWKGDGKPPIPAGKTLHPTWRPAGDLPQPSVKR